MHYTHPPEARTIGRELECIREAMGMHLSDVAAGLPVAFRHLRALEQGDLSALPRAQALRELRAYAHFLGLDPEATAARYDNALDGTAVSGLS